MNSKLLKIINSSLEKKEVHTENIEIKFIPGNLYPLSEEHFAYKTSIDDYYPFEYLRDCDLPYKKDVKNLAMYIEYCNDIKAYKFLFGEYYIFLFAGQGYFDYCDKYCEEILYGCNNTET